MELTTEQRNILAHVVLDPDAWVAHALETAGEEAVLAKIAIWEPVYEAEKVKPDYKNRIQRDEAEEEMKKPTPEQLFAKEKEALIQAKIREQAISALKTEGKLTADGELAVILFEE